MEYLLAMWLCSTVPGNDCTQIYTGIKEFKDNYECTIYGYKSSVLIMEDLDRKFVNKYGAHTQFTCTPQEVKQEV